MKKIGVKKSIEEANYKFNWQRVYKIAFWGLVIGETLFLSTKAMIVLGSLHGSELINPELLWEQVRNVSNYIFGTIAIGNFLGKIVAYKVKRRRGNNNLKTIAEELNPEKDKIDCVSLKNAEVITKTEAEEHYFNEDFPQSSDKSETTINYIIMRSLNGRIIVAKEIINSIKRYDGQKSIVQNLDYRLLGHEEARNIVEDYPTVKQRVLEKVRR